MSTPARTIEVGPQGLRIEDLLAVSIDGAPLALSTDAAFQARIAAGAQHLERMLADGGQIYGVTTGYGDSCTVGVPPELVAELPLHLTRYHGCGYGAHLSPEATLAVLVARLNSLARGYSGVRPILLERLALMINRRILPRIPEEGSVGASGDLTPLSYVGAALVGEREVLFEGRIQPAAEVWRQLGLTPLTLAPKEGLALMNGTAVMTALACLAYSRADYLLQLATRITALNVVALEGNPEHFDERLFAAKPHPGQTQVAAWLRQDLAVAEPLPPLHRLQDRYSLRCAPHVIGVLQDAQPFLITTIENELNSANDNPIIDPDGEQVLHGGHFFPIHGLIFDHGIGRPPRLAKQGEALADYLWRFGGHLQVLQPQLLQGDKRGHGVCSLQWRA